MSVERRLLRSMKLRLLVLAALASFSCVTWAFEGNIQRLLFYSDLNLDTTPVKDLQPLIKSEKTIIVPMLDNKVLFREFENGEVVEPLYLSGSGSGRGSGELSLDDQNRYLYLGQDPYGVQYTAVEFKDMLAFEKMYGPLEEEDEDGGKLSLRSLREVSDKIPDYEAVSILARAVGLNTWHTRTKHCSRCGTEVKSERGGAVLRCQNPDCKASNYPRIEPATMNFITDESNQYALLGRKANWPEGRFSCLAGFLEVGETLEQCVIRETFEESGVATDEDSVTYVGSQPWPFPSSLMIGYRGVALRSEGQGDDELPLIAFDEKEMQDVRWIHWNDVQEGLLATTGSTALGTDREGFTERDKAMEGALHFPGASSMARVMLTEWILEMQEAGAE